MEKSVRHLDLLHTFEALASGRLAMGIRFEGPRATTCISRQPAVFVASQRCVAPDYGSHPPRARTLVTKCAQELPKRMLRRDSTQAAELYGGFSSSRCVKTKELENNDWLLTARGI